MRVELNPIGLIVDVAVGIASAVAGIALLYFTVRPRIDLKPELRFAVRRDGSQINRVAYKVKPLLWVFRIAVVDLLFARP